METTQGIVAEAIFHVQFHALMFVGAVGVLAGGGIALYAWMLGGAIQKKQSSRRPPCAPNTMPPNDMAWRSKERQRPHISDVQVCNDDRRFFRRFSLN